MAKAKKKQDANFKALEALNGMLLHDNQGEEEFPLLVDLMTPRSEDGRLTIEGATVRIAASGTAYRVTIAVPSLGRQTSLVTASLTTLWADVEAGLSSGRLAWDFDYDAKKKARREREK